jgi:hypothetical protein
MKTSTFSQAAKEIILTAIVAMLLFAGLAATPAVAATEHFASPSVATSVQASVSTSIAEVVALEQQYLSKEEVLTHTKQRFDNGEVDIAVLFSHALALDDAESKLVAARTKLLLAMSHAKFAKNATVNHKASITQI